MVMKYRLLFTCCCLLLALSCFAQKQYALSSPDGKLKVVLTADNTLSWSITHEETVVLKPSTIALNGIDAKGKKKVGIWEDKVKVTKVARRSVNTSFATPFYKKAESP